MKYYLHDTNAFQDEKITELFIMHGYEGIGLFYTVLEKLALQEKPIKTVVLKKQLSVGKKLDKVWSYLEEIELISSNNGETFNENILKFSEKYQINKDKTKERVSKWRDSQAVKKNVTRYNDVRNAPNNTILNITELKEKKRERVKAKIPKLIGFRSSKKRKRKAPLIPRVPPRPPRPRRADPVNLNRTAESVNVPFAAWWLAYDYNAKEGYCKQVWVELTDLERTKALLHTPDYVKANPNKRFRKTPENYLIDKVFNDEIVPRHESTNTGATKGSTPRPGYPTGQARGQHQTRRKGYITADDLNRNSQSERNPGPAGVGQPIVLNVE
jgi:hypothetical protein